MNHPVVTKGITKGAAHGIATGMRRSLIAAGAATLLLAGCASAPLKPEGAANARNKLTELQGDAKLANLAPVALKDAEAAVVTAEIPQKDAQLAAHRVYVADRLVDTARALSEARYAEDQREVLRRERATARLDARTQEADAATSRAVAAQAESAQQKSAADMARSDADASRQAAVRSNEQALELQQQIDALQAKVTDRGIVLTLGDVLFATGKSDLRDSGHANLDKLVTFLGKYPERTVAIEGHTDNVGSEAYNQGLSERRAESVRAYLTGQGIAATRITAAGKGENDPVAGNDSQSGRQQNRRVEVIIDNVATASR